jgi:hypothetical protein
MISQLSKLILLLAESLQYLHVSSNSPSNHLSISEAKEGVQPGDLGFGPKHCQMVWKAAAFFPPVLL